MKDTVVQILNFFGWAWWVEVKTENPRCTYYFGPFANQQEAQEMSSGYVDDLKDEGAQGISVYIQRMKPDELTVFDELGETPDHERFPTLSGQLS
ncbi:DUF1816 domain-containing protein [Spirulina subsalsa]|uniref:DUF1816 domain-containing protein n=1 Tax=Spirulina subsalsa TaxID=54311 RepID=UPI00030AEECB|nr:DUF1816 domain-containing protein [Spirulina subsalsa]